MVLLCSVKVIDDGLAETKDLAEENPEVLKRLISKWRGMNSGMCEPIFRWRTLAYRDINSVIAKQSDL